MAADRGGMGPPSFGPIGADDYEALLQFLYLAPVGLAQMTISGDLVMLNPVSSQLLMPLVPSGHLNNLFVALEGVVPDLRHRLDDFGAPHGMVCDGLRFSTSASAAGKTVPQTLSISLLKLDDQRLMAVLSDVTEQVRRERLLLQNEAWLNAILTDIRDYALVSLDRNGLLDDWNESIGRVTGFTREQAVGQPYSIFYPPGGTTPDRMQDLLRDADDNGWSLDDGWRLRADGTRFWGSAMISPLRGDSLPPLPSLRDEAAAPDSGYSLVIRDITDKRAASEVQRKANSCDHLTGIANRRTFFESAERELDRARRSSRQLSLIMIDADHFKQINDTHGHPAGDVVLQHLAALLTKTFREVDLVARIGGEEFAVLLPSASMESAVASAERLRLAVQTEPVALGGQLVRYTVSAGVATLIGASLSLDELIKRADLALYEAKAAGRNRVVNSSSSQTLSDCPGKTDHVF